MLLSVFLPLFNFMLIALFGRHIGKTGTVYITLYSMLLTVILNVKLFITVLSLNTSYHVLLGSWIHIRDLDINWDFYFDPLAVSMLAMVSIISTLVHMYSFSYMKTDPHFNRFISYLSLFTFFMFILVTASNFVQLFLGWEGVGICSYLLINFWFTRIQANKAAIKAMLMNRIGDIGFLIGVALTFALFKTVDFATLSHLSGVVGELSPAWISWNGYSVGYIDAICFFFLIGVVGKSAQLGLHTWLPAAMEGPTPVSALIHAATMVTAGIFLLIRCSFLFEMSTTIRNLIVILGAFTAFFSAFTAIFLYDIKKIIAYSTCSQLGYMALACGLSQYTIGFFHLINHAFFKALLFLTAGAIIHSFNNEQDIRKLSGLYTRMPFIHSAILIGNIAIMGLPFLSGFYSKDLVIEVTYLKGFNIFNAALLNVNLVFIVILLATLCTGIYSLRMYYFLFLRQGVVHNTDLRVASFEQPFFIQLALGVLMVGSIFSGYVLSDIFSVTNDFFQHGHDSISIVNSHGTYFENEYLPWYIKLAPLLCNLVAIIGGLLFISLYQAGVIPQFTSMLLAHMSKENEFAFKQTTPLASFYLWVSRAFNKRAGRFLQIAQNNFYFNEVYNYFAFVNFHYYYHGIFVNFDKGILELVGPTGLSRLYLWLTGQFTILYKKGLTHHLFFVYNTILAYFFIAEIFFM